MSNQASSVESDDLDLQGLAPDFQPERHGIYLKALKRAIDGADMRNIALTGAYGTGKSSILSALDGQYRDRLLVLSLSTVGAAPSGVPDVTSGAAETPTNRIQREVVRQILYRDAPARTRGSRFRRIARYRVRSALVPALGLALLVMGVLFLSGWSGPLAHLIHGRWGRVADYLAAFSVAVSAALVAGWWAHDRLVIEKLTAGPATVSLAAQSPSYFDQYMDEIVYYFEQSGRDIVVFEDIDRFDDVQIFETLRALNTLLNNADQIRKRRRVGRGRRQATPPVLFIYALRDSIFERLGADRDEARVLDAAEEEVRRANRTKFFDLVIPVVPFITHRNARDVMSEAFAGTGVSGDLISVAAGHVAEKRLILNLRNEYAVYAHRLLGKDNSLPDLGPDELLALLLYKSVHLEDFEAIRFGRSDLDELHTAWRALVDARLPLAVARGQRATQRVAASAAAEARAARLGARLDELRKVLWSDHNQPLIVTVDGAPYRGDELRERRLWDAILGRDVVVAISEGPYANHSYPVKQLASLMQVDLDDPVPGADEVRREEDAQRQARSEIDFLRHHTWRQIHQRPDLTAQLGADRPESFADVTSRLIHSRLARDLVAHGYLNDYFALYISEYYGTQLGLDALNFVMHVLDQGRPDASYSLDADDVSAILRDRGDGMLDDPAAYNVSILDYLLGHDDPRALRVIRRISAWSKTDEGFAAHYLATGAHQVACVRQLAPLRPAVVGYLIAEASVGEDLRPVLVDAALSNRGEDADRSAWIHRIGAGEGLVM